MNIFIDTNIFLSFFHLTSNDLEEIDKLIALIDNNEVTLWLPQQVMDEFYRNRENKLADALKKLEQQKIKPQFPQFCKDYNEYDEVREAQKEINKNMSTLIEKVVNDISSRTLQADEKISAIFSKAKVISTSEELIAKAQLRTAINNPPGKSGSLGDAINWESLLDKVEGSEDLFLIADDKDYFSSLDEDKLKDFLADEWKGKKESTVYPYRRLSSFFKDHFPSIELASEYEKDKTIERLYCSTNFGSTHSAIATLSKYSNFTTIQVNDIIKAALENNQVNWILKDNDVSGFYSAILSGYADVIEPPLKEKFTLLISEDEAQMHEGESE